MHHIGLALVPILCDRLLWVALLALIVFLALAAIQVILTGGIVE